VTQERLRQIEDLFHRALEREEKDREAFIREICAGDPYLRQEVEQLLMASRKTKESADWLMEVRQEAEQLFLARHQAPPMAFGAGDDVPTSEVQNPIIGTMLGHYSISHKLGEGGMGVVYQGRDEQLERDVAIKVLPASHEGDSVARARLLHEARAAASLNHPNICTVYEIGEANGQIFIAMELVAGQSLRRQLEEKGPLPSAQIVDYGLQLTDALAHAHDRGIVHRDLKSANVIVTPGGRCKVLDFGLAKRVENEAEPDRTTQNVITKTGIIAGTPAYMSPEQLRGKTADARTDIWALGVMMYEAAAGVMPFKGNTSFELVSAILNEKLQPLPAKVPVALRSVVERCLEKDPEKRFRLATDVHAELEAIRGGEASSVSAWVHSFRRRRFALAISGVFVTVMLLAGLVIFSRLAVRDRLISLFSPRVESVAVMPLANLSGDSEQDYLADGMTDALITELNKLSGLKRVIGRSSVMRYKNANRQTADIARELNVASMITGAVIRAGDLVRVTIQLINPVTGEQLWADRYERDFRNILALQNDVLRSIIEKLRVKLTPEEKALLVQPRPVNPAAYENYLRGMVHWANYTPEEVEKAGEYLQLALKEDPDFIEAMEGQVSVLVYKAGEAADAREFLTKLDEFEQRIKAIDPAVPLGPNQQFYWKWDWAAADEGYKYFYKHRPGCTPYFIFYSDFLASMKRMKEAGEAVERCLELDPFNPLAQDSKGRYLIYAHRYDEAIAYLNDFIKSGNDFARRAAPVRLWTAYHHKGMYEEAFKQAQASFSEVPPLEQPLEQGYKEGGYKAAMQRLADLLVLTPAANALSWTPNIARLYAYAGDKDHAIEWLEEAYRRQDYGLVQLQIDPDWDTLRTDLRFQKILASMKFPQ